MRAAVRVREPISLCERTHLKSHAQGQCKTCMRASARVGEPISLCEKSPSQASCTSVREGARPSSSAALLGGGGGLRPPCRSAAAAHVGAARPRGGALLQQAARLRHTTVLVRWQLLVLVDDARVVHAPPNSVADRSGCLRVHGQPPHPRIGPEDLLPVPAPTDVELALGPLLSLEILDGGVILQHKLHVKLDEVREGADQRERHPVRYPDNGARDAEHGPVVRVREADDEPEPAIQLWHRENHHNGEADVHVGQQLDEELAVVEANAVVDPGAVVVHAEDHAAQGPAIVRAIRLVGLRLAAPPRLVAAALPLPNLRRGPTLRPPALAGGHAARVCAHGLHEAGQHKEDERVENHARRAGERDARCRHVGKDKGVVQHHEEHQDKEYREGALQLRLGPASIPPQIQAAVAL
mmetsp:Transcript_17214/g.55140  ORF Transcript_17214/g.55140 Transcript_17214/m.55140 type:complete len:411 (+) Transcript_17214:325-1557(+)